MPATKPSLPAYTERAYDLCDVFDALAADRGDLLADLYARRLLGQATKDHPQAAKKALGETEAAVYLVAFKAAAAVGGTPTEQGIAQLQAKIGNDDVDALIGALASLSKEELLQLTQQYTPPTAGTATLTDSGPQSAVTTKGYNPSTDPFAIAANADQAQPYRVKDAGTDDPNWRPAYQRLGVTCARYPREYPDGQGYLTAELDQLNEHLEADLKVNGGPIGSAPWERR